MTLAVPTRWLRPLLWPNSCAQRMPSSASEKRTTASEEPGTGAQPMIPAPIEPHQLIWLTALIQPGCAISALNSAPLSIEPSPEASVCTGPLRRNSVSQATSPAESETWSTSVASAKMRSASASVSGVVEWRRTLRSWRTGGGPTGSPAAHSV